MARTDPRPHTRTGRDAKCPQCGASFWLHRSAENRGRKYCSLPCSVEARRALVYDDKRMERRCAHCGEWKLFSEYAESRGAKSGTRSLQANCVQCSAVLAADWAKKNPLRRREINRKSAERNKGKKKTLTAEQRDRKNALAREWRKKNSEKVRTWNKLRTHRQRAAGDMPSAPDLHYTRCMQDSRCTYCGDLLGVDGSSIHLDHKVPVSRGGTNDGKNLQWLCGPCNMKKGTQTHEEYSAKVGTYELPPPPIPDWFDVTAFVNAMQAGKYMSALGMIEDVKKRVSANVA